MGCTIKVTDDEQSKLDIIQNETYSKSDPTTLEVLFYRLDWKRRPELCIFQKIENRIIEKEEAINIDDLIDTVEFEGLKNFDSLIEGKYILFYLYSDMGVVITRNIDKINYFLGMKIDEIIKLCIVDISIVVMTESEYFYLHDVKKQSKYFFDLTNKEINITERIEKMNLGKDENLSDTEIDLNDEIIEEEKDQCKFMQTVDPSLLVMNENEQKEGEQENEEGNELIEGENKVNEKEIDLSQKDNPKTDINNINNNVSAKNINDLNPKKEEINEDEDNNEENEIEEKPYEIKDDTLIISASEMNEKINKELKNYCLTLQQRINHLTIL